MEERGKWGQGKQQTDTQRNVVVQMHIIHAEVFVASWSKKLLLCAAGAG
jgi:uncharacterized protein YeaC (DUF1315 family)